MAVRYRRQAWYVAVLVTASGAWLGYALAAAGGGPSPAVTVFCVAAYLLVWHLGLPAPAVGLISLERVPQVGTLLIFDPGTAAVINALASLIFPFTSRRYRQGSFKVAALRGLHNAAMSTFMLLCAGGLYQALGGRMPLASLSSMDLVPLLALVLVLQAVNLLMMAVFYWLDGRDVNRLLTPLYALSDLVFAPAGVLAALLYAQSDRTPFGLYAGLLALFVLSFNAISKITGDAGDPGAQSRRSRQAGEALRGAQRVDALGSQLLERCHTLFRFDEFYLVLADRERSELDIRLHEREGVRLPSRRKPISSGAFGWVLAHGEPLLVEDGHDPPPEIWARAEHTVHPTRSVLIVPLAHAGHALGLISLQDARPGRFVRADLHVLSELAAGAAVALADARAYEELDDYKARLEQRVTERTEALELADAEKERLLRELRSESRQLERQTREDPLTGVANRREFDERLMLEIRRAQRHGGRLALAMLDLDHFKQINDRYGHALGDAVLREVADTMRRQCRAIDVIARYGGEEFALILPEAEGTSALAVCERIRGSLEATDWSRLHADLEVTISVGVSEWQAGQLAEDLITETDRRLYRAKDSGRNRVVAVPREAPA